MEKMQINVLSVREKQGKVVARARAEARDATIHIEVRFTAISDWGQAELWREVRDQVLRYLDPN